MTETIQQQKILIFDTGDDHINAEIKRKLVNFDVKIVPNPKIQYFNLYYTDKLDLCQKLMSIYATVTNLSVGSVFLPPRHTQVLGFYMAMDYNKTSKGMITDALGINTKNLNQVNSKLDRSGYLIKDKYNCRKRHLSSELQHMKDTFLNGEPDRMFLSIKLIKKTSPNQNVTLSESGSVKE